jgi:hypothetical protein
LGRGRKIVFTALVPVSTVGATFDLPVRKEVRVPYAECNGDLVIRAVPLPPGPSSRCA